jgi:hypothetical protein
MHQRSLTRPTCLVLLLLSAALLSGCSFDASGFGARSGDGLGPADGPGQIDGGHLKDGPQDQRLLDTGPTDQKASDHKPLDQKPPLDQKAPPDQKPLPDQTPPCYGLTCALGCDVASGRCKRIKASNFDAATVFPHATATLAAGSSFHFNTDTGLVEVDGVTLRSPGAAGTTKAGVYWQQQAPSGGYPGLGFFGVKRLTLSAGKTLTVAGKRAFALFSRGAVQIAGTVSAAAAGVNAGSGGFSGGPKNGADGATCFGGQGGGGGQSGSGSGQKEAGGGGGGRKASGGKGGEYTSYPQTAGGLGGVAVGQVTLVPLFGGCGGGAGGGPDTGYTTGNGGYGGGSGGAIQITVNDTLTVTGTIRVSGAGGGGGHYGAGGGGGGSGGVVLLEAHSVNVSGLVAANGGGGGAGCKGLYQHSAPNGDDGLSSTSSASGAPAQPPWGGAGGAGGALSKQSGTNAPNLNNGGGGGGAAGRIRINGKVVSVGGNDASPAPSINKNIGTW